MKAFIKTIDENAWLANLQRELDLSGDKNKDVPKIVSQDFPAVAVEVRENDQVHVPTTQFDVGGAKGSS